jgi:hypothetical protein
MQNDKELWIFIFIFQWNIQWTRSMARGLGGAARVHCGPRQREQKGAVAPCRHAARRHYGSPVLTIGEGGG